MTFREDFLKFNVGHVMTIIIFVATSVWSASAYKERQSLLEAKQVTDNTAQATATAAARREFRDALTSQVTAIADVRLEFRTAIDNTTRSLKDLADAAKENVVQTQKLTDARLNMLEQGQRDNREIVSKLATLEAKVEGVRDAVSELRRNQPPNSSVPRN